ncbi:helix-turn-helix domain-containing protein [Prescottella soli]|uniref:Helix-turn-helix domain-containing protein n=1 Tax=Prescottella soli TaxID=1543852 RepID=A0ABW9FWD2_9NOCA
MEALEQGNTRDPLSRQASPPTDRVVAVVELLATTREPSSVAAIASRLHLNRSTVTAILESLDRVGWVQRRQDRKYTLGAGLVSVVEAVRVSVPLLDGAEQLMQDLARRTGCGAALILVGSTQVTFVNIARGGGGIPAGVEVGVHLPLAAPMGATVVANRDEDEQRAWLATGPESERPAFEGLLSEVRRQGGAVFGLGDTAPQILSVLSDMVDLLTEHPTQAPLRRKVLDLLMGLGGRAYTKAELAVADPLPVSYVSVPVFDNRGRAQYELQVGPLRTGVSKAERELYLREIQHTASELGALRP